jgi:hypothetical protein
VSQIIPDVVPGNLVLVSAGNYLTDMKFGKSMPAQVLLKQPTLGVVIEQLSDRKVIFVQLEDNSCIFANDSSIHKL